MSVIIGLVYTESKTEIMLICVANRYWSVREIGGGFMVQEIFVSPAIDQII